METRNYDGPTNTQTLHNVSSTDICVNAGVVPATLAPQTVLEPLQ